MRRLLVALLVSGCTVGPDYQVPEIPMPDRWGQELEGGLFAGEADLARWWTVLEDPVLDDLIERASRGNLDLRIALHRIGEARAQLGISRSELFPAVDATGEATRLRPSGDSPFALPTVEDTSVFGAGLDAGWELDLAGRIRRSVEASTGELQATVEDGRDILVSLLGEVALTYVDLRTYQERLAIAQSNVETQQESLRIARSRFNNGLSPELDVQQAAANLASTESLIPALEEATAVTIHRIAVLLGEQPGAMRAELSVSGTVPLPPEKVVVGIPANLLRQRPDVRSVERQLAAQTARIGVATADLYPRFALLGSFGWEAEEAKDLLSSSSRVWNIGPSMRWNLFSGGRVRSNIDVQSERMEQLLAAYENIVLQAVEEVENALSGYVKEQQRRDALERAVKAARRSAFLSRDQYTKGLTDFNNVLDSERTVLSLEDQLANSRGRVTANLTRVYKALGGGWQLPADG